MQTVENVSDHRRVWPALQTPEGTTLELAPGETAEVALPEDFEDPYLKVLSAAKAKAKAETPEPEQSGETEKEQS